ncbi:DHA2 family efflux MFS transporter permease subunit [Aquella oligotrophica]|uniref:Major facilitator superfamily (MFS) profile domain-containing protein n=1 Tax=Aquella oligotrophica TaxID=2067065 RepID=A0A2I7N620_9NEIS|nr:DHA2 family efflux MFS transporter permease subunit [Aquella oligotrophica]AUR51882.1 hypothetical protein CUN60_06085 [Aquella oligotrophica]
MKKINKKLLVACALNLLSLSELIDLTIIGIAIPHIMGSLNADLQDVSLTMTNYMVAIAMVIPLSGSVINKFGIKKTALISTFIFGFASLGCGLSTNMTGLVIARFIQGLGGAFLPTLAQAYSASNFSGKLRVRMLNIHALFLILGPIIGPSLGGFLVESLTWRWIFFINIPICIISGILIIIFATKDSVIQTRIDFPSFVFLAIAVGLFEFLLDKGNRYGWFESNLLISVFVGSVLALIFFSWRALLGKSIINFRIFRYYNYTLSCVAIFIYMIVMIGSFVYFPALLQLGYDCSASETGKIIAIRGISALLGALVFFRLNKIFGLKVIMLLGVAFLSISTYLLTRISPNYNLNYFLLILIIQGIGVAGVFINIFEIAYFGLSKVDNNDAAGIHNFFRNLGNSIGTSLTASILTHQQQLYWHNMAINANLSVKTFQNISPNEDMNILLIIQQIKRQSYLLANINFFVLTLFGTVILICISFFFIEARK